MAEPTEIKEKISESIYELFKADNQLIMDIVNGVMEDSDFIKTIEEAIRNDADNES
jgi:hypothetical protein